MSESVGPLLKGDHVEVFYRRSQDPYGYFPVDTAFNGLIRPRLGRTDGWIGALVAEDWPPADGATPPPPACPPPVRIRHTHPHWSNAEGQRLNPEDDTDMLVTMPRPEVRLPMAGRAPPALSLLVVRWGGEPGHFNEEQWGRASASISDTYIHTFLDEACFGVLGPNYEVRTGVQPSVPWRAIPRGIPDPNPTHDGSRNLQPPGRMATRRPQQSKRTRGCAASSRG